jgi:hypothetical protein
MPCYFPHLELLFAHFEEIFQLPFPDEDVS